MSLESEICKAAEQCMITSEKGTEHTAITLDVI